MFNFPLAPPSASNFAAEHDAIFYTLCALTFFFTLIVVAAIIFFASKYRAGSKADRSRPVYEDLRLELTWTIVPLVLGIVMFFLGARLFVEERTPPKNAEEIFVVGKQWMWHVQHPNGVRENNTLHVPIGKPIRLTMISQDVIHDFFIPAFRTQFMVVPGRYTMMWFTPTLAGNYHLFCNMYCGTQHSEMGGTVYVMSQKDYANWLANAGQRVIPATMAQNGQRLYNRIGCNNCHGAQDNPRAPSLMNIYGKKRQFTNAAPEIANDDYIRESILRPYNKISAGYGTTMPAYEGQLTEEDVLGLNAYIKSNLAPSGPVTPNPEPDATPTIRQTNPSVNAIAATPGEGH